MKNFDEMNLSEKLKHLRESKGLTQGALSRIADVSVAEICRIEKGERQNPSINLLNKLLKALEVNNDIYLQVVRFSNSN